jgi:SpoVK/Ycf46/Vps4 family AAA+-type ATPase
VKYYNEISKIVKGSLSGNKKQVNSYLELLVQKLDADEYTLEAEGLRRLSKNSPDIDLNSAYARPIPVEKDSRLNLADKTLPNEEEHQVFLPEASNKLVNSFVSYIQNKDKLIEANIPLNPSLLLWGEPGTGKSKLAGWVAAKLNLPLITARSDALISSYLGSTSKNIRSLLDYAQNEPCVLFLDEFDALAKARDDKNEIGELKRVVVSLLQNIDALKDTVLIAATNHIHLLDPAIGRRFHYKLELSAPDKEERVSILFNILNEHSQPHDDFDILGEISDGMTGAELEMSIFDFLRIAIVEDGQVDTYELTRRLLLTKHHWLNFQSENKNENILKLKEIDSNLYSGQLISKLWGISPSYVSKILKGTA